MINLRDFIDIFHINNSTIDIYNQRTGQLMLTARGEINPSLFLAVWRIQRIENNNNGTLSLYIDFMED